MTYLLTVTGNVKGRMVYPGDVFETEGVDAARIAALIKRGSIYKAGEDYPEITPATCGTQMGLGKIERDASGRAEINLKPMQPVRGKDYDTELAGIQAAQTRASDSERAEAQAALAAAAVTAGAEIEARDHVDDVAGASEAAAEAQALDAEERKVAVDLQTGEVADSHEGEDTGDDAVQVS